MRAGAQCSGSRSGAAARRSPESDHAVEDAAAPSCTRICCARLGIERANQVWTLDITYIPMARGFVYLVAVMDWYSRKVLAWRLSITMDVEFCVAAMADGDHPLRRSRDREYGSGQPG